MSIEILSAAALKRSLCLRDLTDPTDGPHALQRLLDAVLVALSAAWGVAPSVHRQSPIVSVADNYDRLRYPADGPARESRYTRYVCDVALLRTQTSAMIPRALRDLPRAPTDHLLACPGLVYRRDRIDRLHTGEPHQVDLWRVRSGQPLGRDDLREMIALVVEAALPGRDWRVEPAVHPYTVDGLQIDVRDADEWVEIGECGLAHPELLREAGLAADSSGLAMGVGLDRLLMLRKGIPDIRLLRSPDARIAEQMLDLEAYRPVSVMPPVRRDLSIAVHAGDVAEDLGDAVRSALGDEAEVVECVEVLSETSYDALPPAAITRMGMNPSQKNVLVRVVLRALDRTLTHAECNLLRDRIYAALHQGSVSEWASAAGAGAGAGGGRLHGEAFLAKAPKPAG